jgi:hypothetical protein
MATLTPVPHRAPVLDSNGMLTPVWAEWLQSVFKNVRSGIPSSLAEVSAALAALQSQVDADWSFKAESTNGQSGLGASAWQRIEFETESHDPQELYDPTTGTLTMTAYASGRPWILSARIFSAAQDLETAGDRALFALYRNGVHYAYLDYDEVDDPNSGRQFMFHGDVFVPPSDLGDGVTFDVRAFIDDNATDLASSTGGNAFWGYRL